MGEFADLYSIVNYLANITRFYSIVKYFFNKKKTSVGVGSRGSRYLSGDVF